ncbi:MAG: hypothetical protein M1347_04045 [Chloroflexi bacterium]|nr:hypothetical protein [Chloroflexota bacterium]
MRKIVGQLLSSRRVIFFLVEGLFARDARVRYESAGLLRLIAENSPQLLYPHFNSLRDVLTSPDAILRGDIRRVIKQLARVDSQQKIGYLAEDYGLSTAFQPL